MGTRHFAFWPSYAGRTVTLPETSLWLNLQVSARRFPNKTAISFYESLLSYAGFEREAEALAGYLQKVCGVKRGDRVGLYLQNSPQFIIGFYAILRADAVVVPINPMNVAGELAYVAGDSGAKVIVVAQDRFAEVAPLLADGTFAHAVVATYADYLVRATDLSIPDFVRAPRAWPETAGAVAWTDALASGHAPAPPTAGADDLSVMPYTSGTTGHPKGCMHTHRTVMQTALAKVVWQSMTAQDVVLTVLPLFHVTGMQNTMNAPIYAGATMIVMARWDREVAADLIARHRVTSLNAVPTMVVDLLSSPTIEQRDLRSLMFVSGGGAAMPEAVATKLQELCKLTYLEGYGLSETMAATHVSPVDRPKKQCLGIPSFGVDARVVDPEALERHVPGAAIAEQPVDETGEILVHGPQVFLGYWNKPEANEACFVDIEGKRFFRTGDLARVDEDGYFFMVDRLKRMINASGFKVWPAEVESMLYAHPAIREAAVIARRDPRRGETVKAVVVLREDQRDAVDEEALIAWARTQMAAYKVPRSIAFVDALPKSGSGKILWRVLQEAEDQQT
ncbi:MAG: long-chain fatty acid--CoA ligase [Polyangiales bacterium]